MKIGIIGAGSVGIAFTRQLLNGQHEVLLSNSRGPETLASVVQELGKGVRAVSVQEASSAPLVVLAVPWLKIDEALHGLPNWEGRIVIDATNQFTTPPQLADLKGAVSTEIVAAKLPGARVVKALNTLLAEKIADSPSVGSGRRVAFISGNAQEAKSTVLDLLDQAGFAVIDLGDLHYGGLLQQAGGPLAGLDLVKYG